MDQGVQDWRVTRLVLLTALAAIAFTFVWLTYERSIEYFLLSGDAPHAEATLGAVEETSTGWRMTVHFADRRGGEHSVPIEVSDNRGYNPFPEGELPERADILYAPDFPDIVQFPATLAYQRGDFMVFVAASLALLIVVGSMLIMIWRQPASS